MENISYLELCLLVQIKFSVSAAQGPRKGGKRSNRRSQSPPKPVETASPAVAEAPSTPEPTSAEYAAIKEVLDSYAAMSVSANITPTYGGSFKEVMAFR